MFLSFVSMATGPETDIKIPRNRAGRGILLDATVVRALLVPALVSLFGDWNWWLPRRARGGGTTEPIAATTRSPSNW